MKNAIAAAMRSLLSRVGLPRARGQDRTGGGEEDPAIMTTELAAVLCVMLGFDGRPTARRPGASSPPSLPGAH